MTSSAALSLVTDVLLDRAAARSAATLHEAAGKIGALPSAIKPHAGDVVLCGRAFPVRSPGGDNLWLHHAIYHAAARDILVVSTDDPEYGYWGEVMAVAAQARGLGGLVIEGGVRDTGRMLDLGFPVFSMPSSIRGTEKNVSGVGSLASPVTVGAVTVDHGDLVVADRDGVVVIPAARASEVVEAAEQRDAEEESIFRSLLAGNTTIDVYQLATPDRLRNAR